MLIHERVYTDDKGNEIARLQEDQNSKVKLTTRGYYRGENLEDSPYKVIINNNIYYKRSRSEAISMIKKLQKLVK